MIKSCLRISLSLFMSVSVLAMSLAAPSAVEAHCESQCSKNGKSGFWIVGGSALIGAAAGALAGWAASDRGHHHHNKSSSHRFPSCPNETLTFTLGSSPVGLTILATIVAPDGSSQQVTLSTGMSTTVVAGPPALSGTYSIIFTVQSGVLAGPVSLGNVAILNTPSGAVTTLVAPQISFVSPGTQSSLEFVLSCPAASSSKGC